MRMCVLTAGDTWTDAIAATLFPVAAEPSWLLCETVLTFYLDPKTFQPVTLTETHSHIHKLTDIMTGG